MHGELPAEVQTRRSQLVSIVRTVFGDPQWFPRGAKIRVGESGEFTGKEFQNYRLQTWVSLEFASSITPQQIGASELIKIILAVTVRCMLADSEPPKFLLRELKLTGAFLGKRAPPSAIGMQSPCKLLRGTEPGLRPLGVIGDSAFVHIETQS